MTPGVEDFFLNTEAVIRTNQLDISKEVLID